MSKRIDLNDFWRGETELANLAAQLTTEREDRDDSVWTGDTYGSDLRSLLQRPGADELVRREIERVSETTGVAVEIELIDRQGPTLQVLDVRLALTANGLEAEE